MVLVVGLVFIGILVFELLREIKVGLVFIQVYNYRIYGEFYYGQWGDFEDFD